MDDPKCNKCGAEICTAMMAVVCPRAEACEFWPADKDSHDFIRELQAIDTRAAAEVGKEVGG